MTVTSVLFSCGQDLPATFREAFSGKQDRLVEKILKGLITDRHKRHLEVTGTDVVGCYSMVTLLTY